MKIYKHLRGGKQNFLVSLFIYLFLKKIYLSPHFETRVIFVKIS